MRSARSTTSGRVYPPLSLGSPVSRSTKRRLTLRTTASAAWMERTPPARSSATVKDPGTPAARYQEETVSIAAVKSR